MKILVTGGNGKLAAQLKKYIQGDFLGKEILDLTKLEDIAKLDPYDIIIHTAKGSIDISLNFEALIKQTNPKKIFAFTSRQGTFINWKKNGNIEYGLEKLILNFIIYRHNIDYENAILIEPGHMGDKNDYTNVAKLFYELYCNEVNLKKNMIYDLIAKRYIPY
jgi:hypothetical protein